MQKHKDLLCNTYEEPFTRSILITLRYNLTEDEEKLKQGLKQELENLTAKLEIIQAKQIVLDEAIETLNKTLILETSNSKDKIALINQNLQNLKEIWNNQDYLLLEQEIEKSKNKFLESEAILTELNKSLSGLVLDYNNIIDELNIAKNNLEELNSLFLTNNLKLLEINNLINEFNDATLLFKQRTKLIEKQDAVYPISEKIRYLINSTKDEIKKETLKKELEVSINYDILCQIAEQCINHTSIAELAEINIYDLNKTCIDINDLRNSIIEINESINSSFLNQSYPNTKDFWDNISAKLQNIKNNIISEYLINLPENKTNAKIIKELLIEKPIIETEDYSKYNLTPALVSELANQMPKSCDIVNISLNKIKDINITKITISQIIPITLTISFEEPQSSCCVFGKCENCCTTEECKNENFPIVFLHGHSVNKAVSAEYSLEGFNQIQEQLEKDGCLNAGAITLYTKLDSPEGLWGLPNIPLTIRASYYFDVFKQPENYIIVQAKSENIDTYSIRLKELIGTIKHKTGKTKVNIMAFSMGGLVARRYIQIFGADNVNKLILIGTPNKGTVGRIRDICPLTGEKLECRDMDANSLFMNKLNSAALPKIPIYNIVGTGCIMEGGMGDGAVLEEKALLEGADNYIINGTCRSALYPLHLDLRNLNLYPEVYDIIKNALKE